MSTSESQEKVAESPDALEGSNETMTPVKKPKIEYEGYQRTITDVVRIHNGKCNGESDKTGISELMLSLDDAIKDCRRLRKRLEGLHKKRNTGYFQKIPRSDPIPEPG